MKIATKFVVAIFLLLNLCVKSFGEETVRIAGEDWPPFSSKELKYYGVMNRIITEAFAMVNIKVEYGFFPGARALLLVKSGEWDATGGWSPSDERAKDYYFSDMLIEEKMVFFHLKTNSFDWKSFGDLKGVEIGTVIGSYYGKEFEAAEKQKKLRIQQVSSDELNFNKLLYNRIAITPKNLDAGLNLLHTKFKLEDRNLITYHPLPLDQGPLVLMFSKKTEDHKRLLLLFNKGLKQLKKDGRYDQFIKESQRGDYIIKK